MRYRRAGIRLIKPTRKTGFRINQRVKIVNGIYRNKTGTIIQILQTRSRFKPVIVKFKQQNGTTMTAQIDSRNLKAMGL